MRELTLAVLCAMAGCIEPQLVMCANGLACPVSARCDEVHHSCVLPDQLVVCRDSADGTDCTTGPISGGCFDGVCLARGCGNRVMESGEMCDDGNQISFDGCRGDCSSTEVCGNGFVDPGEPCDDGDLVSRDGCDSRCQVESAAWTIVAIAPDAVDGHATAYDPVRRRVVTVGRSGDAWEWDGVRWTFFEAPLVVPYAMFYDPVGQEVNLVGGYASSFDPTRPFDVQIYALRNGLWIKVTGGDGPIPYYGGIAATYDVAHHQVLAITTSLLGAPTVWTTDAIGAWVLLPAFPDLTGVAELAFDPGSGLIVAETPAQEWMFDGTDWTSLPTSFGQGVAIAFDPDRGRLVLFDPDSMATYERTGSEWAEIENAAVTCRDGLWWSSLLYYNIATASLDLFSNDGSEICRWDGSWSSVVPALPVRPAGASYDAALGQFVIFHNAHPGAGNAAIETWTSSAGSWHRLELPAAPVGRRNTLAVYSPGRATTVLYGGIAPSSCFDDTCEVLTDAWSFDGSSWAPIAPPVLDDPSYSYRAATYDPEHRRVVMATSAEFWGLGDTDEQWTRLDIARLPGELLALAWDARHGTLVATVVTFGSFSSLLFELRPGGWAPIEIVPSEFTQANATSVVLINDQRGGGVLAIDALHGLAWERVGPDWVSLPPLPVSFSEGWGAYNPVDGSMLFAGDAGGKGKFVAILTRTSATPLESCQAGEDVDGDGLAGCDDSDCYWACSRCAPHTTCH